MLTDWNYRMKRSRKRFEMMTFDRYARCAITQLTSRDFNGDWASAKRYYSQSLACDPENARAFYGLAAVALHEGDPVTARQYATRCNTSILRSDGEILNLLDSIVKNWPELVEK
jgi:Tfp pilus assembly protein PilF